MITIRRTSRFALVVAFAFAALLMSTATAFANPVPAPCNQAGVIRIAVPGALQACYDGTPGHLNLGYRANSLNGGAYYGIAYAGGDCSAILFRPAQNISLGGYICGLDITPPF